MATEQEWRTYDQFAYGIDTNWLPCTDALAGRELRLSLADGSSLELAFVDASTLEWRVTAGPGAGASGPDGYEAIEVDDESIPPEGPEPAPTDQLRSTGKFLGVTADGSIEKNPAGAHIIPLGRTEYPEGLEPV